MHTLLHDLVSVITSSLIFSISFIVLYAMEKRKYLLYWSMSWGLFCAGLITRYLGEQSVAPQFFTYLSLTLHYFSSSFLLLGALKFIYNKKIKEFFIALTALWLIVSMLFNLIINKEALVYSVFLISSSIFIYTGLMLYRNTKHLGIGGKITGITLIVWGIHKADYPIFANSEWFLPIGYQIAVILTLVTATGILLMHFEKTKKDIAGREIFFKSLADISKDIVLTVSCKPNIKLEYVSTSIVNITGYTNEEILSNNNLANQVIIDYIIRHIGLLNVMKPENSVFNRHEILTKTGKPVVLEFTCTDYYGIDGSVDKIVGIARDITDRMLSFDNLIERQDWYEALFQKSNTIQMLINSETGYIADANTAMAKFSKYTTLQLRNMIFSSLFINLEEANRFWQNSGKSSVVDRYQQRIANGTYKDVIINSAPIKFDDTNYLYINITDISSEIFFETELKNIKTLHSAILEAVDEGVVGVNKVGEIFFANRFACELLGYNYEELVGKDHHTTIHYKSDKGVLDIADCPIMKSINNAEEFGSFRDQLVRKDGTLVPVETTTGQFKYFNEEVKNIIVFRDITEELDSERKMLAQIDENKVLLREVHHRVKNNLQIICSLLSLQTDTIDDEASTNRLNDSIARIRSMALLHELLYQTKGLSTLSISQYIDRLVLDIHSMFVKTDDIKIETDLEDININLDIAVPCGLIITELITNAIKHAFTGIDGDKIISIIFNQINDEKKLIVRDNGRGVDSIESVLESQSLGMTIVNSLIKQIGGEVTYESENGLSITIIF
ncbi:MAG: hypothetical protein C0603_04375 [Denitrovibrio sp.]|nr:MAG: hypothetical protein C0603_04375 [Denitrovibrio sp.]